MARSTARSVASQKRDGDAAGAGARGAADAVDIAFRLVRQIEIDDVGDAGHVDAARGDVGRHQHAGAAGAEALQRSLRAASGYLLPWMRLGLDLRGLADARPPCWRRAWCG